jgi:hypothetical protein
MILDLLWCDQGRLGAGISIIRLHDPDAVISFTQEHWRAPVDWDTGYSDLTGYTAARTEMLYLPVPNLL